MINLFQVLDTDLRTVTCHLDRLSPECVSRFVVPLDLVYFPGDAGLEVRLSCLSPCLSPCSLVKTQYFVPPEVCLHTLYTPV